MMFHTSMPEDAAAVARPAHRDQVGFRAATSEHILRLVEGRLGVEVLPEALVRPVTEKSEGNPLFAEEIVSFLTEQGVLRADAGKVEFDAQCSGGGASDERG